MSDDKQESKAVVLIRLAQADCEFYPDQHGSAFAWVKNPGRVMMLNSREFKSFLTRRFFEAYGEAVSPEAVSAALSVLAAEASEKQRVVLWTRVCNKGDEILLDLCDEENHVVRITGKGWKIEVIDGPIFRRYSHMRDYLIEAGTPEDVRRFVKFLRLKDQDDSVLLVGLIGTLYFDIPHAILVLYGPQGAAKTTGSAALRELVDPSSLSTLSIPHDQAQFVQLLSHHYLPAFDNTNGLRQYQVDTLCRAATGEGFTKRELYTNEDDVVFSYRRPLILNGINPPSSRGDFLDRALLIGLSRVPRAERLEDAEMKRRLEEILPRVRGAVFDALVKTIGLVGEVRAELRELPRMADFAVWGEAFCRALGYEKMEFFDRYTKKIEETSAVVLESDVVGELIIKLMTDEKLGAPYRTAPGMWEGTASELLKVLANVNDEIKFVKEVELPRSPRTLSNWLGELEANLADYGIRMTRRREGKEGRRVITITKTPPPREDRPTSSASSARHNETDEKQADATADASKGGIVSASSADPGRDETKAADALTMLTQMAYTPLGGGAPSGKDANPATIGKILAVGGAFWEVFGSLEGPGHEAVAKDTLTKVLIERFRISQDHALELSKAAFKEGKLYEPKPGYYRRVGA